jgi:organic hydroperoxide reductase OsmC/OhrA
MSSPESNWRAVISSHGSVIKVFKIEMKIRARIHNEQGQNRINLSTNENVHSIDVPPRPTGLGSSANGGELLFLALATCYCNDIYREAAARGIDVLGVEVEVEGDFSGIGEPASNLTYRAKVRARGASQEAVKLLMEYTDKVAEVQNTIRRGVDIRLVGKAVDIAD